MDRHKLLWKDLKLTCKNDRVETEPATGTDGLPEVHLGEGPGAGRVLDGLHVEGAQHQDLLGREKIRLLDKNIWTVTRVNSTDHETFYAEAFPGRLISSLLINISIVSY